MTSFEVMGRGFPYVVLPGFGCGRWMFREMAERLKDQACFVLLDSRGMGDADKANASYGLKDLAEDALAVMASLNFERFGVIGISMGGMTALELVRLAPAKVHALMLLCSLAPGPAFFPPPSFSREDIYRIYTSPDREAIEKLVSASSHQDFVVNQQTRFQTWVSLRMQHPPDPDQLVFQVKAVDDYLQGQLDLSTIKCPTLVLSGEDDTFVNPKNSQRLAEQLPHAQSIFIPQAAHLFFFEKAAEVATTMASFMETVCPSP